jgi:phage tail tape-measure protein
VEKAMAAIMAIGVAMILTVVGVIIGGLALEFMLSAMGCYLNAPQLADSTASHRAKPTDARVNWEATSRCLLPSVESQKF